MGLGWREVQERVAGPDACRYVYTRGRGKLEVACGTIETVVQLLDDSLNWPLGSQSWSGAAASAGAIQCAGPPLVTGPVQLGSAAPPSYAACKCCWHR